jgi:hypothetical protein
VRKRFFLFLVTLDEHVEFYPPFHILGIVHGSWILCIEIAFYVGSLQE